MCVIALELLSDPKPLVSYMSYPAKFMSRTIDFLGKVVLERASWGNPERDPNRWDKLVFVLGNALLDFVEFGHNSHMVGYKNPFLRQNQNQVGMCFNSLGVLESSRGLYNRNLNPAISARRAMK